MKLKTAAITLVIVLLILSLCACGTDSGKDEGEESASSAVELLPGELRYTGTSSADNIEKIAVSFVLSEDKTSIHDFNVFISNFSGEVWNGNVKTSIEVSNTLSTFQNEIAIDYQGSNQNISVGDNTIESLNFFDDGTADMVFTYCYKEYSTGLDSDDVKITVPGIKFSMNSSTSAE